MKSITEIYSQLAIPKKVVITTHQKPDPDAMGSSLALSQFLQSFGHEVTVVSPTNWGMTLNWMPGANKVLDFEAKLQKPQALEAIENAEWIFCLDYNHFSRTKTLADVLFANGATKILIDHHREPDEANFTYGISDTSKSSTCEMIYDFIVAAGHKDRITLPIAECIYAGLIGDTGSFRYDSVTEQVHLLVAYLKSIGLEHAKVHSHLFDNYLENRLRFIGHVLLNRMEVFYEYNTALISIPKADLLKYDIKVGDTEGLVNYPQSIQGIKLVGLVIDRDEERKWSFRSKGEFDCNTFARTYFNGGGHYNAAGGHTKDSLEETVAKFKRVIKENEDQLQ